MLSSWPGKFLNQFLKNAKIFTKKTRFEGGHAIGDQYGGPLSITNLFPMPHAFNTVAYKKEEGQLQKQLPNVNTTMEVRKIRLVLYSMVSLKTCFLMSPIL